MPVNSMTLIERLKPKLIKGALKMRGEGASYEDISHYLSTAAKMNVGRESVRYWFKRREKAFSVLIEQRDASGAVLRSVATVEEEAEQTFVDMPEIVEMEIVLPDPEPEPVRVHTHRFMSLPNGTVKCDCGAVQ